MKKLALYIIAVAFLSFGCNKRLDSFLFNNDNSIDKYYLDNYDGGELEDLPNSYYVPSSSIHQFKYTIKDKGENLKMSAIYVGDISQIATDTIILYCHKNSKHMDHYWNRQKLLSYVGDFGRYGVLMFDYPGYGLSEGKPTEENMYEATNGAMKWLKENGLTNERLVIYGYSLGSAPASKSVGDKPFVLKPSKLILEAPFASSAVMVQDAAGLNMPSSYFVNTKINNADQMKSCEVPLLWMHGIDDDFLSMYTHGRVVYSNHTKSWKMKNEVIGAGHSNLPTFMGYNAYRNRILSFLLQ